MKQELLNARLAPTKPEGVIHEHDKQMLENEKQILENGKQILENGKHILKHENEKQELLARIDNMKQELLDRIDNARLAQGKAPGLNNKWFNKWFNKWLKNPPTKPGGVSHEHEILEAPKEHENEKQEILDELGNIQHKLQEIKEGMPNTNPITCACTPNSEEMKTKMQKIGARTESTEKDVKLILKEIQTKMPDIGNKDPEVVSHVNEKQILYELGNI
jgi:hypothetical protein